MNSSSSSFSFFFSLVFRSDVLRICLFIYFFTSFLKTFAATNFVTETRVLMWNKNVIETILMSVFIDLIEWIRWFSSSCLQINLLNCISFSSIPSLLLFLLFFRLSFAHSVYRLRKQQQFCVFLFVCFQLFTVFAIESNDKIEYILILTLKIDHKTEFCFMLKKSFFFFNFLLVLSSFFLRITVFLLS